MDTNFAERTNFSVTDVFTPTTPARVTFVERDKINEKLVNALATPGKQIVVYGHSGNGKSTLLVNKLHQTYAGHVTTRCMKGMAVNDLVLSAFDKLDKYYTAEKSETRKSGKTASIDATYGAIKTQIQANAAIEQTNKSVRMLPPQLTPDNLAALMGEKQLCWLIEDFHKVETSEKAKLSQLMKVFMDCAYEYPSAKIICTGAVETARQVVEFDPEMRNRVSEIEVNLMTENEILSIIEKGEAALNIEFPDSAKGVIAKYSSGLGAVCHQLCLNACNAIGLTETSPEKIQISTEQLEKAIGIYVEECSDTVRSNFEKARKLTRKSTVKHADIILDALCSFDESGADRFTLLKKIQRTSSSYTDAILKRQISSLTTLTKGALIRFSENSGLYSFSNPIYRAYALTLFHKNGTKNNQSVSADRLTLSDLIQLLEKQLRTINHPRPTRSTKQIS